MPNDTSFAVQYKKLIDHNFDPDPQQLARTRSNLLEQLSAQAPPAPGRPLWTKTKKSATIENAEQTGEEEK